jgi:hypothetical protein
VVCHEQEVYGSRQQVVVVEVPGVRIDVSENEIFATAHLSNLQKETRPVFDRT